MTSRAIHVPACVGRRGLPRGDLFQEGTVDVHLPVIRTVDTINVTSGFPNYHERPEHGADCDLAGPPGQPRRSDRHGHFLVDPNWGIRSCAAERPVHSVKPT